MNYKHYYNIREKPLNFQAYQWVSHAPRSFRTINVLIRHAKRKVTRRRRITLRVRLQLQMGCHDNLISKRFVHNGNRKFI